MLVNTAATGKVYRVELDKPHQEYRDKDGGLLPGCSTIAGLFPDPGNLTGWYASEERKMILDKYEGLDWLKTPAELFYELKATLPEQSAAHTIFKRSGRVGTIAHRMFEAYVNEGTFDAVGLAADEVAEAEIRYGLVRDWWNASGYRLHSSERPFSCDRWGFGGTVDLIGKAKNDELHLLDIKTSNSVRVKHKVQVGGGYRLGCVDELGLHISQVKIIHAGGGMKKAKEITMDMKSQAWAGRAFLACLGLWKELKAN